MNTSTPILNVTPRNSMGPPRIIPDSAAIELTPLRKNRRSVAFHLNEAPDDNDERVERRRSVALRRSILQTAQATTSDSPNLNESARILSDEDLKSHLQICAKLYAENKITIKNAWTLKIIDVLKQLVSKNNPDILKVAGTSLEIAAKVYGLRVDDLHALALKLASSLARNFDKKGGEDDEDEENLDPNAPPQEPKKKRQKKKRLLLSGDKKHTVNADPKNWKAPVPKLESAAFSTKTDPTVSAVGNLLTNRIRMDPAGYKFMFMSQEKAWSRKSGCDASVKDIKKFPIPDKKPTNYTGCAPFKDFSLDEWDPDEENKELERKSQNTHRWDELVCDDNGIPIPELDGSIHDVVPDGDIDDNDDIVEDDIVVPHINQGIERIVDFRPTEQNLAGTIERSEYSYNTVISTASGKIDQIWAGPSHWKLKFIRSSQPVYTGKEEQKEDAAAKTKKRGPRKKVEAKLIDIAQLIKKPPIDYETAARWKPKKRSFVVDEAKITLPLLESACKYLFEHIRELMVVSTMQPVSKLQRDVEYDVDGYRYDNPNDSNYVPQDVGGDDNGADLADDHFDNVDENPSTPDSQEGGGALVGNNLIEAPLMVQQTHINYATRAKKMDMKKLKHAAWMTLTHEEVLDFSAKVIPQAFSQMYKDLPKHLTEQMKTELTCPLAFVALLHLCNEQNLALKQENNTDFDIFGPTL